MWLKAGASLRKALGQLIGGPFAQMGGNPSCRVYNSGNISLNDSTITALTFDSERFDTDTMHSTSSSPERITFTTAGKYTVMGSLRYAANATGQRLIRVRLNGTTTIDSDFRDAAAADVTELSISTLYEFAAGDYVELLAFQSSTGALNVLAAGNNSPEFMAVRVG